MAHRADLWQRRSRAVTRARKRLRAGDPEGLHDLRVSLRRTEVAAGALGYARIARRAKKIVRSLSRERQLEVDRNLLSRVRELGLISEDSATTVDARWQAAIRSGSRSIARAVEGRLLKRVIRKLGRLASSGNAERPPLADLLAARAEAERRLAAASELEDDDALHRYRLAVKRARYLAEELVGEGREEFARAADREQSAQEALGRWNDLRLFRRGLERERRQAEKRGAIALAGELDRLARALEAPLASSRRAAVESARRLSNVFSFAARSA